MLFLRNLSLSASSFISHRSAGLQPPSRLALCSPRLSTRNSHSSALTLYALVNFLPHTRTSLVPGQDSHARDANQHCNDLLECLLAARRVLEELGQDGRDDEEE